MAEKPGGGGSEGDPAEVWGRRIGRTLGAVAVVALFAWLVVTYIVE